MVFIKMKINFLGHTMFWNTLGLDYLVENEEFEKKLTNEDTTLENILDNVNCLQEIRSNNQKVLTLYVFYNFWQD